MSSDFWGGKKEIESVCTNCVCFGSSLRLYVCVHGNLCVRQESVWVRDSRMQMKPLKSGSLFPLHLEGHPILYFEHHFDISPPEMRPCGTLVLFAALQTMRNHPDWLYRISHPKRYPQQISNKLFAWCRHSAEPIAQHEPWALPFEEVFNIMGFLAFGASRQHLLLENS